MSHQSRELCSPMAGGRLPPTLIAAGLVIVLLVAATTRHSSAAGGSSAVEAECQELSRIVARRSESMLESTRFRETAKRAYQVCLSDRAAFRHIVR